MRPSSSVSGIHWKRRATAPICSKWRRNGRERNPLKQASRRARMSRLLVTGGAGFIGSHFVHYWTGRHPGERVVVLDALTYAGDLANLQSARCPHMRFVHGDICDESLVLSTLREEQIDTIVHFAAESHVDRSIEGPDAFIQTNVVGTHQLLKAARKV